MLPFRVVRAAVVLVFIMVMVGMLSSSVSEARPLKVLIGTTDESPYSETAPAQTLAIFNRTVLGSLFKISNSFELLPGHIEKWRWLSQENCYEVSLRPGIRFHNGRVATAADLEFTLLRGFFTSHRSFYNIYLGRIVGIDEVAKHSTYQSGIVPGVKITGPLTLKIYLKSPNPAFLFSLTEAYFSMVPREEMKEDLLNWKATPIGAGPYRVVRPFANGKVEVERVEPTKTGGAKYITLYTRDSEPLYDVSNIGFEGSPDNKYRTMSLPRPSFVYSIFFSYLHPLSKDPSFRKAIQIGIDRSALTKDLPGTSPAYELLPKTLWGRENKLDPYDLAKAKQLVATLPEELRSQEIKVSVFSGKRASPLRLKILERLKHQLAGLGLKLTFVLDQNKFWSKEDAVKYPMHIVGRVVNYSDPIIMFSSFRKGSPFPFEMPQEEDPVFESLFAKAATATDSENRYETARKVTRYINEKALMVAMAELRETFYYDPKTVVDMGEQNEVLGIEIERIKVNLKLSKLAE